MDGRICLTSRERKVLLEIVPGAGQVRRASALLLLDRGCSWSLITMVLFCSSGTLSRWKNWYELEGLDDLLGERRGQHGRSAWFREWVVRWTRTPGDFGFLRARWTSSLLGAVLWQITGLNVSRETIRRWLHQADLVWRRPRPVVGPVDPDREPKLRRIRRLLEQLSPSETAVFQDEVDIRIIQVGLVPSITDHEVMVPARTKEVPEMICALRYNRHQGDSEPMAASCCLK